MFKHSVEFVWKLADLHAKIIHCDGINISPVS